jgi:cytosine/adenosine deaminase-related metal-dependent hydrolase
MREMIVRGRYVVTDASTLPSEGWIENGALLIRGDRVAAVGAYEELRERHAGAAEIGTGEDIIIPGLINTHHHGWGLTSLQLGVVDDFFEAWLPASWQLKVVDAYLDTLWADLRNIRSGVTTLLHAGYMRDWASYEGETTSKLRAHDSSGIRVAYGVHIMNQNTFVYRADADFLAELPADLAEAVRLAMGELKPPSSADFFALTEQMLAAYDSHSRIRIMMAPVAPQWCSDQLLIQIRQRAREWGIGVHLHCLETPHQREYGRRAYGKSIIEHLGELDLLGPDVSLGHAVWLTAKEMDICASTRTSICHNASSNLRLRVGILPAARLLEKGVNVSVGMDGITLNDDEDMLQELRLVAKLHGLPDRLEYTPCPTSGDVLTMGTVNGGRTLGMPDDIGKLEPGYKADVVMVNPDRLAWPYLDPRIHFVDALLYRAKGTDVHTVLIDGEVVLQDGVFTKIAEDEVVQALQESAAGDQPLLATRWSQLIDDLKPHIRRFYTKREMTPTEPFYTVSSSR